MKKTLLCLFALALSACSSMDSMMSSAPMAPAKTMEGALTNSAGMTLYTFDRDTTPGKSMCNGGCATLWPPFMAMADSKVSGDYSIVTRDDGSKQWAYKGKPLYVFSKDGKPGDKTGNGFNNVWKTATP